MCLLVHVTLSHSQIMCACANPLNAKMHFVQSMHFTLVSATHCARKIQLEVLRNGNPWKQSSSLILHRQHMSWYILSIEMLKSKSIYCLKMQSLASLSALLCTQTASVLPSCPSPAEEFKHPSEFHHIVSSQEFHPPYGLRSFRPLELRSQEGGGSGSALIFPDA